MSKEPAGDPVRLSALVLYFWGLSKGRGAASFSLSTIAKVLDVSERTVVTMMPVVLEHLQGKGKAAWSNGRLSIEYQKVTAPVDPADVRAVFEHWQATLDKQSARLTDGRRAKIRSRLAEGCTVDQLKRAVDGVAQSSFHNGSNNRGQTYHRIDLIFRNGENVERFEAMAKSRKRSVLERLEDLT